MPVVSTMNVLNQVVQGVRPYSQALIKIINNDDSAGTCYLTGAVNSTGIQGLFAEDLFLINPGEIVNRTYQVPYDFFQFDVTCSLQGIEVAIYGISPDSFYSPLSLRELNISRITSEIRSDFSVADAYFPAISFQRIPSFALPEGVAAAVYPQSFDILSKQPVRYMLVEGGTMDGSFVNFPTSTTSIPTNDTVLQVNTTATTITGGRVLTQGTSAGLSGAYANTTVYFAAQDLAYSLNSGIILTLVVSSLTGSDDLVVTFRMQEEW
ncbi:hypothetical protein [Paenibacillus sp. 453mf]|uniref:hypothetical protein n=1 Tax=Paenibacillus sp. 453mf TaxID=1761874 RepID=UPI0008ED2B6E|nr:hypothetical protein [Paenibacillus sp. 453mf]SFS77464.1 hypothetical protein SAMN04488601_103160 [Paenibacillus sp. 453mf]